ncbi:molybdopterin oxidoreductase family protein [Alkalimarinus sediminis]|uniref:Molybdopterin oxidoreductase family protein n=1 Tax=Alkalimarinus sediminis TaxID=1632866 RepID=A0A9E8HKI9_9ALTE|nr:molybdopterin oxidoreductase family protein [Alkalimarinus sediminis]UZW76335.1 molybdopterin oxidoreductase family protein [Alkalimarinus sediminis]
MEQSINTSAIDSQGQGLHYRTCTLCEAMCGVEIKTENNKIVSIKGDKNDPFSRGHICPKATALQDLHEDPDRIRRPIERTDSGWKEISWNEALTKTANRLKDIQHNYGRDAVGAYLGNPNVHNMGAMLFGKDLLHKLRTKNKFSATSVDQLPHHVVSHLLFGHQLMIPVPDIDRTDHFLIIGGNPLASNGSIMSVPDVKNRLKAIKKRKGKVIVIDPRRSETAEIASEHHFITPGTDALLLLAMLNTVFEEQLCSPGDLKKHVNNLYSLEPVVAPYTAERVAPITGVSAEATRQLVREFCAAKTAICYGRMGCSVQQFGTLTQYLIMAFNILTGRLDAPGGMMFTHPAADILPKSSKGHFGKIKSRVRGLNGFGGELPVAALAEEILTEGKGQIKAMVLAAGNPVLSTPNGTQLDKAFSQLDFMVSIDFYRNESNRHANIILPPVSALEREHYDIVFHTLAVRNTAKYSEALFNPSEDAMHDWQIFLELAYRLNGKPTLKQTLEHRAKMALGPKAVLDLLLRSGPYGGGLNLFKGISLSQLKKNPHGVDLGPLNAKLPMGLFTPDKKINMSLSFFKPDIQRLEQHFFGQESKKTNHNSLRLIGRRHVRSNNTWLHNSRRLVKGKSRCNMMIHPESASALGLENGQMAKVSSRTGSVTIATEITDEIMPGVISIPHGWGHNREGTGWKIAEKHAGVSVNDLTDELFLDELSGNAALNGVPVTVEAQH